MQNIYTRVKIVLEMSLDRIGDPAYRLICVFVAYSQTVLQC